MSDQANDKLDKANALRARLGRVQKTISKASDEKIKLVRELEQLEKSCFHQWSKVTLIKGTLDKYERQCEFCGRTEKSKDVTVKF
jgi:hypothetical protein